MKLWITGAKGLLGSLLVKLCEKRKLAYVATGREIDITQTDQVRSFAKHQTPTHIINCAAYTAVDLAEKEKEKAFQVNATGAENLARVANEQKMALLQLSTNFIFDGTSQTPYKENAAPNPVNVYGQSKWEGEKRVLKAHPEACIIRTSWLFGLGGKNFVSSILQIMQKERSLRTASDQSGKPTYALDLAHACLDLLDEKGVFHFANQDALSRYEIACSIREHARKKGIPIQCEEIIPVSSSEFPAAAIRPAHAVLATDKVEALVKVRNWETVLTEYLNNV